MQWFGSWLVLWRALVLLSLAEPTADLVGQLLRLRMPGLKRTARNRGDDHPVAVVSVVHTTGRLHDPTKDMLSSILEAP